jgi:hypothetical protein
MDATTFDKIKYFIRLCGITVYTVLGCAIARFLVSLYFRPGRVGLELTIVFR